MGWGWAGPLLAVVLVAVLALVLLLWRTHSLARRVGSFECARRGPDEDSWTSGIASYGVGRLDWHRTVSLSPNPAARWLRRDLVLLGWHRREVAGGASHVVEVRCRYRGAEIVLAMHEEALAGLTSWLEAAPPGERAAWAAT
jgi:hypothetical protein